MREVFCRLLRNALWTYIWGSKHILCCGYLDCVMPREVKLDSEIETSTICEAFGFHQTFRDSLRGHSFFLKLSSPFCLEKIRDSSWKQPEVTSKNSLLYRLDPENSTNSCKSRGSNLPVHFNNTCETIQTIKGAHIWKAIKYLKDVTLQKQCVPFCCYNGGVSRYAQAKHWDWTQGQWPKKSAEFLRFLAKMEV